MDLATSPSSRRNRSTKERSSRETKRSSAGRLGSIDIAGTISSWASRSSSTRTISTSSTLKFVALILVWTIPTTARRPRLAHPRDEIMRTMERIYRHRMTTTSGGNLSMRDDDGGVWITPARVDKGRLRREDIIRVRTDGTVEGLHPPSSELPFHRAIYAARPEVRGIVHAHPVALVAFSVCRKVPDTRLLPQARQVCGEVGFAPYALPGSEGLGANIAATFAEGFHCVVLENHGVVTSGESLQEAFERFETLEFTAKTVIKASILGTVKYLSAADAVKPRSLMATAATIAASPATSDERELRRQICEFVRRSYQQRLMISRGLLGESTPTRS